MPRPKIVLHFDLHSPYTYLAYYILRNSDIFRSCDITYVPVVIIGFVKAVGLVPPWANQNKVKWMRTDLDRWAQHYDIPWTSGWPEKYPNTLTVQVQRVLVACSIEAPQKYLEVADALFHAFWAEHKPVQLASVYSSVLVDILGSQLAAVVEEKSTSDEIKELLRQNTADAINDGACGLPWMKAVNATGNEERYWGFDRLGEVAMFLGLDRMPPPML